MKHSPARYFVLPGIVLAVWAVLGLCLPGTSAFAQEPDNVFDTEPANDLDVENPDADADDAEVDPFASDEAPPAPGDFPAQELSAETLQDFLLAEIAAARGDFQLSAKSFIALAHKTRDPRIAHRAAYIATQAKDPRLLAEAAQLWREIAPESKEARQFAEYVEHGRSPGLEKLETFLARTLAENPSKLTASLLELNRALIKIENKDIARNLVFRLTEPYLKHPEAHFARAQAALLAKRPMEATGALDRAIELRPDWLPALMLKAHILSEAGSADKATQILETALARNPGNLDIRLGYARSLLVANRFREARVEFNTLLAAAPDDRDLLYTVGMLSSELGDNAAAEPPLKRALAAGHPQADIIRIQLGKIAASRGEHAAARKWFDAVSPGSRTTEARILSARSLAREGRLDQARKLLHDGQTPDVQRRYLLAESQLLVDAGRTRQAFDLIDKTLRANPDDTDLLYESAMLADRIGRHEIMEIRLRKLISLTPDHAHAYNALGYSLADRGQRLNEAEKLIARALEILPRDPYILDSMGWLRFRRGDFSGALERLEEAYVLRTDPEIAAHLGEVLWRIGRNEEARRILDEALSTHPGNTSLRKTIHRLYPKTGKKL